MSESSEATASGGTAGKPNKAGESFAFRERLYASWWTWPLPIAVAVLLAAEVHMGYPGVRAWLPYVVLVPAAVALLLWLSRTTIDITGEELAAGDARLSLRFIADAETVTAAEKRRALGPDLDPAAFIVHRPWVSTAVRIWLDDDNDPTPYWILSTRRPEELVTALTSSSGPHGAANTPQQQ
ncbi:DUF3093 family protein [Halopolyspora algeriensis]|uniref:DUF3093 family protein n=1 Tax=Halopolyspora algeriensis TaxID=1500506 RepID=A0A368VTT7_9ACTN|nr:DUF3093 domain-containing protein [Halopolyspora algeriensis]RCW43987.1 DUF3093 family protein [Halopolyspora algeriensis]TQM53510.1 DUF3093 family protein [Halopolyspora algeriensis]